MPYDSDSLERPRTPATPEDVALLALGALAETRDLETGAHLLRTQHYMRVLAEGLAPHRRFRAFLTPAAVLLCFKSAPLHDIGKVGIPDRILRKPGRLTPEEYDIMKGHAALGRAAIEAAERRAGHPVPFLAFAKDIAWAHHERWDGGGYPRGLAGEAIPIPARLMAVADVYDALVAPRVYKPGLGLGLARDILAAGAGSHFDPDVVEAFLAAESTFREIARTFADSLPPGPPGAAV